MTRTRTRRTTLAVAAFSLSAALTACGQSEDPSAADPSTEDVQETTAPADDDAMSDDDATADDDAATDDGSDVTEDDSSSTKIPNPNGGSSTQPAIPLGPVDESITSREDVQAAVADEAKRSSVETGDVDVVGYADVTWPNGAVGCETEGTMYTQAIVPGHLLILEVDGELRQYHAAQGKPFSYCAQPSAPSSIDSLGPPTSDM